MQGQAAPAATDVQHPVARSEAKLAGDMFFLEFLGLLQRDLSIREIGAGILHVLIQEEAIEIIPDVIVMSYIARGSLLRIELRNQSGALPEQRRQPCCRKSVCQEVHPEEIQQVVKVAEFNGQAACHVSLADLQFRIQKDPPKPGIRGDSDPDRPDAIGSVSRCFSIRKPDLEASLADRPFQPVSCDRAYECHARSPLESTCRSPGGTY